MERRRRNRVLPLPWVSQHPSNADISYSFHYTSVGVGLRGIGAQGINSELPAKCGCSGSRWRLVDNVAEEGEEREKGKGDLRINRGMFRFEMINNTPLPTGSSRRLLRIRK